MSRQTRNCALLLGGLFLMVEAGAGLAAERMREDKVHVRNWNEFAEACLDLHNELMAEHEVRQESSIGGYHNQPDLYREVKYFDEDSGWLLSKIQWERENPDNVHSIEVYIRDGQGRVIRDYSATFLPHYRNAPVQTLINLHHYNGDLHAFRQFDASADRIYEFCEGSLEGEKVQIRLFEDALAGSDDDVDALMETPAYKACFDALPAKLGAYLTPQ